MINTLLKIEDIYTCPLNKRNMFDSVGVHEV